MCPTIGFFVNDKNKPKRKCVDIADCNDFFTTHRCTVIYTEYALKISELIIQFGYHG